MEMDAHSNRNCQVICLYKSLKTQTNQVISCHGPKPEDRERSVCVQAFHNYPGTQGPGEQLAPAFQLHSPLWLTPSSPEKGDKRRHNTILIISMSN